MDAEAKCTWNFQRMAGLDQVTLRTAEELRHLKDLDPKLWMILSCPSSGLEFDPRTLTLIDSDGDGRIRTAEVLAAVEWTCARLADPAALVDSPGSMPISAIDTSGESGRQLAATARSVLMRCGKPEDGALSQEDVEAAMAGATQNTFNGDGILPPLPELGEDMCSFVNDALRVAGGVTDASGKAGIGLPQAEAFMVSLDQWRNWRRALAEAPRPLGDATEEAWRLSLRLKGKLDDYFLRARFAAYVPDSAAVLSAEESLKATAAQTAISEESLADLPLARVTGDEPLTAKTGFNPAWADDMARFFALIAPLLPEKDRLSRDDWQAVQAALAPFAAVEEQKPAPTQAPDTTVPPAGSMDELSDERVDALLSGDLMDRFARLVAEDTAASAALEDIAELERLVLYYLHLHRLLMNFVSFYDFYSLRADTMFQAGTLYIDGRSCRLCLPVQDVATHATLAVYSGLCLLYCSCTRTQGGETMNIVAAMTAGDANLLINGRHGVFVDNQGRDWDATLVKIVQNPISLREAVMAPYKRLGRMITEQITKFATTRQNKFMADAGKQAAAPDPQAAKAPFDVGRSAGIFAAVGLALGAIGTALGSLGNALFSLQWWQFPLLILGIFLVISGPSVVMAWMKLRRRTLGPLLDASGWAVNSWLPINFRLGRALTSQAKLPPNIRRGTVDPLAEEERPHLRAAVLALIAVLVLALAGGAWWWTHRTAAVPEAEKAAVQTEQTGKPDAKAPAKTQAKKTAVKGEKTAGSEAAKPAPEAGKADAAKSGAPKAEAGTEAPKAGTPKADASKADAPKPDASRADAPKADAKPAQEKPEAPAKGK